LREVGTVIVFEIDTAVFGTHRVSEPMDETTEAREWRSRDSALLHLRVRSLILERRSGF